MAVRRKKKAAPAKKSRKRGKVGRPVGYKCSAATRAKMSKSHRARHAKRKKAATPARRKKARRR